MFCRISVPCSAVIHHFGWRRLHTDISDMVTMLHGCRLQSNFVELGCPSAIISNSGASRTQGQLNLCSPQARRCLGKARKKEIRKALLPPVYIHRSFSLQAYVIAINLLFPAFATRGEKWSPPQHFHQFSLDLCTHLPTRCPGNDPASIQADLDVPHLTQRLPPPV